MTPEQLAGIPSRLAAINAHLSAIAQGRDPGGHLFAIERLARTARAELVEARRESRSEPRP